MKKLKEYTKPELDRFRELCNFTEDERRLFDYLARGYSEVQAVFALPSTPRTVGRWMASIRRKISQI